MHRPRIGLVGYFGYGNYGDELFLDVYNRYFYDCELIRLRDKTANAVDKIGTLDAIIIGGGDLFIPKYFAESYFDPRFLERPVYLHGVGVPLWMGEDPKVIERMAAFVQHPNVKKINVRDVESANWVAAKLKPTAPIDHSADMVFSLELPCVPKDPKKKVFGLITRKLNMNAEQWRNIAALCDRARSFGYTIHNIVLGTEGIRADDLENLKSFTYDSMVTIDPNDIGELTKAIGACHAAASMKFHGCVVATAYGVPCVALATTDKFVSLYKAIDRPDLIAHFIHPDLVERLPKYIAPIPATTRAALRSEAVEAILRLRRQVLNEIA